MKPAETPSATEAATIARAKDLPRKTLSKTNSDGLVKGDETRKAMTGPQDMADRNMDRITAMVPQAQRGVREPKATEPTIPTPDFRLMYALNFLPST